MLKKNQRAYSVNTARSIRESQCFPWRTCIMPYRHDILYGLKVSAHKRPWLAGRPCLSKHGDTLAVLCRFMPEQIVTSRAFGPSCAVILISIGEVYWGREVLQRSLMTTVHACPPGTTTILEDDMSLSNIQGPAQRSHRKPMFVA